MVNEDLSDEFDLLKIKDISCMDDTLRMVRSTDLFNFWIRKSDESLQVLENTYYFMSPLNLDDYC